MFCVLIYFIFHTIAGNRGIIAYFKINQKIEKSNNDLNILKAERIDLEHKVNLLKSPIDRDMLDEQARKVFGVAKPTEKVFVVSKPDDKNSTKITNNSSDKSESQ